MRTSLLCMLIIFCMTIYTSEGVQCPNNCDDGNPCTTDVCANSGCRHFIVATGTTCDDGIYCNGIDTCNSTGICSHSGNPCPASNSSTVCYSSCSETSKNCLAPTGTTCDDGKFCTLTDTCNGNGTCVGTGSTCAIGTSCNSTCSENNKTCTAPDNTICTSESWCNGTGVCSSGVCTSMVSPCSATSECNNYCNDTLKSCFSPEGTTCSSANNQCSQAVCSGTGVCTYSARTGSCNLNMTCFTNETCYGTECLGVREETCGCNINTDCDDGNPCTVDTCHAGTCVYNEAVNNTSCDDGLWCTGRDFCFNGHCTVHTGNPCGNMTCNNTCNENLKTCLAPNRTSCDDGIYCNGVDECFSGVCTHTGDPCAGGQICNNVCDENAESCLVPMGTSCSDGKFCNGYEICNGLGNCTSPGNPCVNGSECNNTCSELNQNCYTNSSVACTGGRNCRILVAHCDTGRCDIEQISGCIDTPTHVSSSTTSTVSTVSTPTTFNRLPTVTGSNDNNGTGSSTGQDTSSSNNNVPIIVGSVVGGTLIAVVIAVGAAIVLKRRTPPKHIEKEEYEAEEFTIMYPGAVSPNGTPISSPQVRSQMSLVYGQRRTPLPPYSTPSRLQLSPGAQRNSHSQFLATSGTLEATIINMTEVEIVKDLGSGNFSDVYMGIWHKREANGITIDVEVALKQLKMREQLDEFIHEAKTLQSLQHPHIVRYYGIFADGTTEYIATEYMRMGSLLELLHSEAVFSEDQMIEMALGAALGMTYLESTKIVHRDLSCRNLLVSLDARGHHLVKVSDFGMSKWVSESYYVASDAMIPVRWSAIEVLKHKKFSSKSDVWSFGVCMWEIFEKGREPYTHMSNRQVVNAVLNGERLERPKDCPEDMYQLMLMCWAEDPTTRPNFEHILDLLWKATGARQAATAKQAQFFSHSETVHNTTYEQTTAAVRRASLNTEDARSRGSSIISAPADESKKSQNLDEGAPEKRAPVTIKVSAESPYASNPAQLSLSVAESYVAESDVGEDELFDVDISS